MELPFLRLLWGVHGSTTGGAARAAAAAAASAAGGVGDGGLVVEVEPAELKYLGESLRQTLVGRVTRRVMGGEVRDTGDAQGSGM